MYACLRFRGSPVLFVSELIAPILHAGNILHELEAWNKDINLSVSLLLLCGPQSLSRVVR